MEKIGRDYELAVILEAESESKEKSAVNIVRKIAEWIKKAGAKVMSEENMGIRELAYPIKKKQRGFYHFFKFKAEPVALEPMKDKLRREESILRFLIVRLD